MLYFRKVLAFLILSPILVPVLICLMPLYAVEWALTQLEIEIKR